MALPWWEVSGLILSKTEVDSLNQIYNAEVSLQVWEDDDEACEIRSGERSGLEQLVDNLQAASRATSIIVDIVTNIRITASQITALRALVPSAFQSDDDLLGHVVYTPGTRQVYPTSEFVSGDLVRINGSSNGTLRFRTVY